MDFSVTLVADEIDMYSDASGKIELGALCGSSWMYQTWPREFLIERKPSIEYLELFAVTAVVLSWIDRFRNRRVILFCDNQSVVDMINAISTSCMKCMVLIRLIVLKGLVENVRIFAKHVKGSKNVLADALSRDQIDTFHLECRKRNKVMEAKPVPVPEVMWPMEKVWNSFKTANSVISLQDREQHVDQNPKENGTLIHLLDLQTLQKSLWSMYKMY